MEKQLLHKSIIPFIIGMLLGKRLRDEAQASTVRNGSQHLFLEDDEECAQFSQTTTDGGEEVAGSWAEEQRLLWATSPCGKSNGELILIVWFCFFEGPHKKVRQIVKGASFMARFDDFSRRVTVALMQSNVGGSDRAAAGATTLSMVCNWLVWRPNTD